MGGSPGVVAGLARRPGSGGAARRLAEEPARILIVDDVPTVREGMSELLRGAGYDVAAAASGPEALAALDRRSVDLLLTDLSMPEMTGWDLAAAVRARQVTNTHGRPICIGIYSAVLSGFNREQLTRARIDFAVTKLTEPEAILDAVERALAWSQVE
jgi:CheY-like chemotaxis protein